MRWDRLFLQNEMISSVRSGFASSRGQRAVFDDDCTAFLLINESFSRYVQNQTSRVSGFVLIESSLDDLSNVEKVLFTAKSVKSARSETRQIES